MDQGKLLCESTPTTTKCKTISHYCELYAGPEYDITYKYAYLAIVVWICFAFGPGEPILFPLGLLALLIHYIVEKLSLAYFYQRPISYSDKINQIFTNSLLLAPILYAVLGFWMYSNRQIFDSVTKPLIMLKDPEYHDHLLFPSLTRTSPGTPLILLLFPMSLFFLFSPTSRIDLLFRAIELKGRNMMEVGLSKLGKSQRVIHNSVVKPSDYQACEPFFSLLTQKDKEWLILYEDALYEWFGVERIPLSKLEEIVDAKPCNKHFMRLPFYEILSKRTYCQQFEFNLIATRAEEEENLSGSDPMSGNRKPMQSFRSRSLRSAQHQNSQIFRSTI